MNRTFVRIAPWILLFVLAYVLGGWRGRQAATQAARAERGADPSSEAGEATGATPPESVAHEDRVLQGLAELHAAARTMATPDARTYAFFEQLEPVDLSSIADAIRAMPPGNEQDLFFSMVMRRWAHADGPAALEQATRFPALGTRQNAVLVVWETWGAREPDLAAARARDLPAGSGRDRAFAGVLTGAGTLDPRLALALWSAAPEDFRGSGLGPQVLEQIVAAACGTGKRETVLAMIEEATDETIRTRLITAVCGEWGGHYPDEALAWLATTVPEEAAREPGMTRIFEALVQKDPPRAAAWGLGFPDPRRRSAMVAAAMARWVEVDVAEAELWINEQPDSLELDGATFAMAAHYIGSKNMPRAFAWISRIRQDAARGELLGNLGRAWSRDQPAEFQAFLDQTSLTRAQRDLLLAKVQPPS